MLDDGAAPDMGAVQTFDVFIRFSDHNQGGSPDGASNRKFLDRFGIAFLGWELEGDNLQCAVTAVALLIPKLATRKSCDNGPNSKANSG